MTLIAVHSEDHTKRKIVCIQNPEPLNISANGTQICTGPPYLRSLVVNMWK